MTAQEDIKFLVNKFCDARHLTYFYSGEFVQNERFNILLFKFTGHLKSDDVFPILMASKNISNVSVLVSMDFDFSYLQIVFTL